MRKQELVQAIEKREKNETRKAREQERGKERKAA